MTKEQFIPLAREVFGHFGFQSQAAKKFRVNQSTVYRWTTGDIPIPPEIGRAMRAAAAEKVACITKLLAA